jgi:hypothetical protein
MTRCVECRLRTRNIIERTAARDERLALVPEQYRRARVPERDWPRGRRWCAGCQTFVLHQDCVGSRCRTCASIANHASRTKSVYGIDGERYNALLNVQGGRCAICRNMPKNGRLAVDHDHRTGDVRGLCCVRCNHELLGAAHDSVEVLRAAIYYLENPPMSGRWVQPEVRDGSMPHGQVPF